MSDTHRFHSSCPVQPEQMQLARFVEGDVPGDNQRLVRFDFEVLWVTETESSITMLVNGIKVGAFQTYNDFYGVTSSLSIVEDAQRLTTQFALSAATPIVEIMVTTRLIETPAKLAPVREFGLRTCLEYEVLPDRWFFGDEEIFQRIETFGYDKDTADEWRPYSQSLQAKRGSAIKVWSSFAPTTEDQARERFFTHCEKARGIYLQAAAAKVEVK